ncbi:MAG TPA: rhomboid family intramembrane serine protease [Candidatus Methanoperedenaceae archaeon]|nr:rhomboid family intramembrane serine protease [Candidatus Methanoperedenaceae archaeon]
MKITHALILFAAFDFLLIGQNDAIAHTAHLSGVVAGLLLGLQYRKKQRQYRFM